METCVALYDFKKKFEVVAKLLLFFFLNFVHNSKAKNEVFCPCDVCSIYVMQIIAKP